MSEQNRQDHQTDFTTNKGVKGEGAAEEMQNPGAQRAEGGKNKEVKHDPTRSHEEGAENTQNKDAGMDPNPLPE